MRRPLLAASLAAVGALAPSFLSAPAGAPVPFQALLLPPTLDGPRAATRPFEPTLKDLLEGEVILRSDAQASRIWERLFGQTWLPGTVDFSTEFVVLMGGGLLAAEDFSISCVERVDASWDDLGGSVTDAFLAITATTSVPGVPPPTPPPMSWRVAAIRLPQAAHDDLVFHRATAFLP